MLVYNAWAYAWPVAKLALPSVSVRYAALIARGDSLGWPLYKQLLQAAAVALREVSWAPAISSLTLWSTLLVLMLVFRRMSKGIHPPVDEPDLDRGRAWTARVTLILAILLFMPSPLVAY
jgi:hypothetical protein